MKLLHILLTTSLWAAILGCSPARTDSPEADITGPLVGTYTLSRLTNQDAASAYTVTGTGSATIVSVDAKTVSIRLNTAAKLTRAGTTRNANQDVTTNYQVVPAGTDYQLRQATNTVGTVSGTRLTTTITAPGSLLDPADVRLTAEFTKR